MSSMDEVFERMQQFQGSLETFTEALGGAIRDMRAKYQAVEPLWANDEAHRAYRQLWQPLEDILDRFVVHESPSYQDFLDQKLRALDSYLRG